MGMMNNSNRCFKIIFNMMPFLDVLTKDIFYTNGIFFI